MWQIMVVFRYVPAFFCLICFAEAVGGLLLLFDSNPYCLLICTMLVAILCNKYKWIMELPCRMGFLW
jgi:hypothetical protein